MWIRAKDGRIYNGGAISSFGLEEKPDLEYEDGPYGGAISKPTGKPSRWAIVGLSSNTHFELANYASIDEANERMNHFMLSSGERYDFSQELKPSPKGITIPRQIAV